VSSLSRPSSACIGGRSEWLWGLVLLLSPVVKAQGPNVAYSYQVRGDVNVVTVGAGAAIPFPATSTGANSVVTLFVKNTSNSTLIVTSASISNSAFTFTGGTSFTIAPNATGSFTISFTPNFVGAVQGTFAFQIGPPNAGVSFTLAGSGVAPSFILSYVINPKGNQTPIVSGGTLPFPNTSVSTPTSATFIIFNQGTGAGTTNAVTFTGASFQVAGLPLLPAQVQPNSALQFTVTFAPTGAGLQTGSLTVQLSNLTANITLSGTGTAASFTYATVTSSGTTPISPNGTIAFPTVPLGQSSTLSVRVENDGNASGVVGSVTVVGGDFVAAGVIPLPRTFAPGESLVFQVVFTPANIGNRTGILLVDNTVLNLSGVGSGTVITLTATVDTVVSPLPNNSTLNFPNTAVGATLSVMVTVTNSGNVAGSVNSISVSGAQFAIGKQPALPAQLSPGASLVFSLVFQPNSVGSVAGALAVDNQTIVLRGSGTAPAPLPTYSFGGLSGKVLPLQQPVVTLQLAQPYPTDVTGSLALTFTSTSFADDSSIQFSTGGRTVAFRIPANSTTALFGQASQIQFQSGTVAGTITLTPAFSVGSVDLTPRPPVTQTVAIDAAAPQLRNLQLGTQTAGSFELLLTGYSTPRSVQNLNLTFTPAPGANLQTTTLQVNTETAFATWYQNPTSTTSGSQFTASIIIDASGSLNAVQSISITAANVAGTSNSMSLSLQ
jgi:hypothetical protein